MPTYRKLFTKSVESEDINAMPDDFTRLLWVMLPLGLCRKGRGKDSPAWIRSKIFPIREDADLLDRIDSALVWYDDRGMIERYEVDGRRYFRILSWHKHQGTTIKEGASIYPPAPSELPTNSGPTPDLLPTSDGAYSQVDAHVDSQVDTHVAAIAPSADADPPVSFSNWPEWQDHIRTSKGKKGGCQSAVHGMIEALYPGLDPPTFAYIAKTASKVGGFGRLADLLWQHSTRPPTGDLLAYIQGVAKSGNHRDRKSKSDYVPELATGFIDEPAREPLPDG